MSYSSASARDFDMQASIVEYGAAPGWRCRPLTTGAQAEQSDTIAAVHMVNFTGHSLITKLKKYCKHLSKPNIALFQQLT